MRPFGALLLGLPLLSGCACSDIGCLDGLAVRFDRIPTGGFRVEARAEDGGAPLVFECPEPSRCCPQPGRCEPYVFFDLIADQVTIRVVGEAGVLERTVRPRYEAQYPNGRFCGAACRVARVRVPFPA